MDGSDYPGDINIEHSGAGNLTKHKIVSHANSDKNVMRT